jgi:hypothetical protein
MASLPLWSHGGHSEHPTPAGQEIRRRRRRRQLLVLLLLPPLRHLVGAGMPLLCLLLGASPATTAGVSPW